jgi:hypothetical protein
VNIARGTFRLSIVIALVVAAYYGISGYKAAMDDEYEKQKLWTTLRCGERFLGQDMSSYASLGRVLINRPALSGFGQTGHRPTKPKDRV